MYWLKGNNSIDDKNWVGAWNVGVYDTKCITHDMGHIN